MKKINLLLLTKALIASFFLMLCSFGLSAQTISNWTVKYDNNFNAVVKANLKNTTNKTITALKFNVSTKPFYSSDTDIFAPKYISKSFTRTIYTNGSATFEIPVNLQEDHKVKGIIIMNVRFSDGTIKQ